MQNPDGRVALRGASRRHRQDSTQLQDYQCSIERSARAGTPNLSNGPDIADQGLGALLTNDVYGSGRLANEAFGLD